MLTLNELKRDVENGSIDTVVVAFTDMQGRLMGKRVHAQYFVDENVADHGVEGCNYLLALDMEMDPIPGYEMANWEGGYGDFAIVPDLATLRTIPWLDRTALVLCDVANHDGCGHLRRETGLPRRAWVKGGGVRAVHRRRRATLLRDVVNHVRFADAVRVLP